MAAIRLRLSRRASWTAVVAVVCLGHLLVLLLLSLAQPLEPQSRPEPHETVIPLEPPKPRTLVEARSHKRRRSATEPPGPAQASAAPARGAGPFPAFPGSGAGSGSGSGSGSGGELADPFATREALRTSFGCDQVDMKLRPDEREKCLNRTGRWNRKAKPIGPAADDPKWAKELADEEDYARRLHEWKTTDCMARGTDLKSSLGPMPPHKGDTEDEDRARRGTC